MVHLKDIASFSDETLKERFRKTSDSVATVGRQ